MAVDCLRAFQDAASVILLPQGHRDMYKTLQLGASWGTVPLSSLRVIFYFQKIKFRDLSLLIIPVINID